MLHLLEKSTSELATPRSARELPMPSCFAAADPVDGGKVVAEVVVVVAGLVVGDAEPADSGVVPVVALSDVASAAGTAQPATGRLHSQRGGAEPTLDLSLSLHHGGED
jgi:hypothetical protein